jgi:hypothetical protein
MVEKLSYSIKQYLQGAIFRSLAFSSEDISVKFEIIPNASNIGVPDLDSLKPLLADADGTKKLPLNSEFKFHSYRYPTRQQNNSCNPVWK